MSDKILSDELPDIKPRKFQWLPVSKTPSWWKACVMLLFWVPIGSEFYCFALVVNVINWAWIYGVVGGARVVARETTQPKRSFRMHWIYSLINIVNVTEIPKSWDEKKAEHCFEVYYQKNGFKGNDTNLESRSIYDTIIKSQVVNHFYYLDRHPARLHNVWILCAPSNTFIITSTNFAVFDGTSILNLEKGFVHTYYEDDHPPLVRSQPDNDELDLQLDQDDDRIRKKLGARLALKVTLQTSLRFGIFYGRWILSRELYDMLGCPSPDNCVVIDSIDRERNPKITESVKGSRGKMFAHLWACSAQAISELENKSRKEDVVQITQISTQLQYYEPKVPRDKAGNWLIGLGQKTTLTDLSDPKWSLDYYKTMIPEVKTCTGQTAWSFINQTCYGLWGSGATANP